MRVDAPRPQPSASGERFQHKRESNLVAKAPGVDRGGDDPVAGRLDSGSLQDSFQV